MKKHMAEPGLYVVCNELPDAAVYQIVNVDGHVVEMSEIKDGKDAGYRHQWVDVSIIKDASVLQMTNAGILKVR